MTSKSVGVAFYVSDGSEESGESDRFSTMCCGSVLRCFTGCYFSRGSYLHCEIFVDDPRDANSVIAYSVTQKEGKVFKISRTFSNDNYIVRSINVASVKAKKLIKFCDDQVGKPIDMWGMLRSPFFPKTTDETSWFCAELTAAALQRVGLFRGKNPAGITMEMIMVAMESHKNRQIDIKQSMYNVIMEGYPTKKKKDEEDRKKGKSKK